MTKPKAKQNRFIVRKKLDLGFLGDDWKECFINFTPVHWKEANSLSSSKLTPEAANALTDEEREKLANETMDLLKEHFVDGKGYTAEGVVELVAEDLEYLPVEIVPKAAVLLRGNIDPKLQAA